MSVSRLRDIPGIGGNVVGDAADAAHDPDILRVENLDTDLRPPAVALAATPTDGRGPSGAHYRRLVFANEPVSRLADLADRFRAAL